MEPDHNHTAKVVGAGAVDILYGVDQTTEAILKFIDKTRQRYDVYADSNTPSFIFNNEDIRRKFIEFKKKKGANTRYITEITKENVDYYKQFIKSVELRHIEGPKGIFRLNETEYQYNAVLDDSKQAAILIRSNSKEVVSQQHLVFDALWDRATPAEERIREIQDERERYLPSKKIQLWSDSSNSEYAIRLKDEPGFLAGTTENVTTVQYTDLVEEVDFLEDLKYDWKYTLKQWISTRYHHDNNIKHDGEKPSSSYPHTSASTGGLHV